ncbi:uncharacterized protein [Diadema antillarum]|uniref:uncharacterized protein isoform X2 n=1 Tax=Diadema antillarum TaxID=105358 RepID=UPI003A8AC4AF
MADSREPSPPFSMPHSVQSYQGSSADGGDNESVMSDLSWDGTPDENILSGSSRAATSLAIHEEEEVPTGLRFLEDPDGDDTLIMDNGELYSQLSEMEEKLKMAGEFGNALLEENQELRSMHQQLQQDLGGKIEALEQERHELRMKLETAQVEKENIAYDLKMEVESLRKELSNQNTVLKVAKSNKQGIIGELMEQKDQNQRLTAQLLEARQERDLIHDRLRLIEEQNESLSLFHHQSSLGKSEQLRAEVVSIRAEKEKLEGRLFILEHEQETAVCSLEEAKERNMMLEKQVMELEQRLQFRETELRDLTRLHEETMQELGMARSRANTHTSSLFDELEPADLTGYESSDEDLDGGQGNLSTGVTKPSGSSHTIHRQMSLADELAESLGAMEASEKSPRLSKSLSLADKFADLGGEQASQQQKQMSHGSDIHSMFKHQRSLAEEFADLGGEPSDSPHSGVQENEVSFEVEHPVHENLVGEQAEMTDGIAGLQQKSISLADEFQAERSQPPSLTEEFPQAHCVPPLKQPNVMSLADELFMASASVPAIKVDSSNTLVFMTPADLMEDQQDFDGQIQAAADKEDEEDDMMMSGITMANSTPTHGLSLADELANTHWEQLHDGGNGEDIIDIGSKRAGRHKGRLSQGGRDIHNDEDDEDVINQETPTASPNRSPQMMELRMKHRQIEDVLHRVHVDLAHIILELHSLVRLPLTDLGIMQASSVLHSLSNATQPLGIQEGIDSDNIVSINIDVDDDDDDSVVGSCDDGRRPEMIGEKVKSQLSILRSMLNIVVNGSPLMGSYYSGDFVVQIEEDQGGGKGKKERKIKPSSQGNAGHSRQNTGLGDRQNTDLVDHQMLETCVSGEKKAALPGQITMQDLEEGCVKDLSFTTSNMASGSTSKSVASGSSNLPPHSGDHFGPWN